MPEKRAKVILEIAQAIGNQLEMSELLAALNDNAEPDRAFRRGRDRDTRRRRGNCLIGRILKSCSLARPAKALRAS